MQEKIKRLEEELARYKAKLVQASKDWAETRGGSRYGDEGLENQIKVLQALIAGVMEEIKELKASGGQK